jgi:hypothetical protein
VSVLAEQPLDEAMQVRLDSLVATLAPVRAALVSHPVYTDLNSLPRLRLFMQHHVFAVWDFMSLLKWLQRELTCVTLPWLPQGDPQTRRLINEIVLGEECDQDGSGGYISHFEMYLDAMRDCQADTLPIRTLVDNLAAGTSLTEALQHPSIPACARDFTQATFQIIATNSPPAVAAAFALGREDLIPDMFRAIVEDSNALPSSLARLKLYLHRHIELDGDEHTPMALRMLALLCGDNDDSWREATEAALFSLTARQQLWNGVAAQFAVVGQDHDDVRQLHS